MSRIGFTEEERRYVARIAGSYDSRLTHLAFYAAALVPALGLGACGFALGNIVYLDFSYFGLAFFILWRIGGEFRYGPLFRSLFAKIDAYEKAGDS